MLNQPPLVGLIGQEFSGHFLSVFLWIISLRKLPGVGYLVRGSDPSGAPALLAEGSAGGLHTLLVTSNGRGASFPPALPACVFLSAGLKGVTWFLGVFNVRRFDA